MPSHLDKDRNRHPIARPEIRAETLGDSYHSAGFVSVGLACIAVGLAAERQRPLRPGTADRVAFVPRTIEAHR